MSGPPGGAGGKTRSSSQQGRFVPPYVQREVSPGFSPVQNETFRQIAEALRTGGIGAQIPIIQQAVSQGREALSNSMTQTEGDLASSGLGRTPYGQQILAQTGQQGRAALGRIPTDYAQQLIGQAPALTQGVLQSILSALAGQSTSTTRGGPYST